MDIAEKKEEILKLIGQLHGGPEGDDEDRRSLGDKLAQRRQALADLRRRRERQGLDLLEDRLLRICQMLEDRIARIEELIRQGGSGQELDSQATAPDMSPAPDLDSMQPDLPTDLLSLPSADTGDQAETQAQADPGPGDKVYSLSGRIDDGVLPDILQMLSSNNKSGIFAVEHNGKRIELYIRQGQMYHATGPGMAGQNAFFAVMALDKGSFSFDESAELPDDKTIDGNTQFMILEALRQIDEERG